MALKPLTLNPEAFKDLATQAQKQDTSSGGFSRSNDEANFPVWRTPAEGRFLMYIPNHTVINGDSDTPVLRADHPNLHRVMDGSKYGNDYRCIRGLNLEGVYDGTCPLCDVSAAEFDWWEAKVTLAGLQAGEDFRSGDSETARNARREIGKQKAVDRPSERTVFPAVMIELEEKGNSVKRTEDGKPAYRIYWMTMSSPQMDKLDKSKVSAPNGELWSNMFLVDYNYDSKGKDRVAMHAARNVTFAYVSAERYGFSEDNLKTFDEMTKEWDIQKAIEMVKTSAFLAQDDLDKLASEATRSHREETLRLRQEIDLITNGPSTNREPVNPATAAASLPSAPASAPEATVSDGPVSAFNLMGGSDANPQSFKI